MCSLLITVNELGSLGTNCYFLTNDKSAETIIVDPAGDFPVIREKCEAMKLKPIAVFLTHGHFDHIMAAEETGNAFQIPIYAGIKEKELLSDAEMNMSSVMGKQIGGTYGGMVELTADIWLKDGEELDLAGFKIKVIGTPGHTAGSLCFYFEKENVCISGDTLFRGSFGRTDLPTGDFAALERSIKSKLFVLPEDTVVYPGHDGKTTVGYEKKNNMICGWE